MLLLAQLDGARDRVSALVEHGATPLAVLVGFIVFVLLFRAPIKQLLGRAKVLGLGPSGLNIDAQTEQTPAAPVSGAVTGNAASSALWRIQPDSPSIGIFEQSIRNDLSTKFSQEPESRKTERLINNLAYSQLELVFERNYRVIYNSQVQFLRFLNQNSGGISVEAAKQYYEGYREKVTALNVLPFETWMQFLQGIAFVNFMNGNYQIGQLGQEFLQWMIRAQVREDRPF